MREIDSLTFTYIHAQKYSQKDSHLVRDGHQDARLVDYNPLCAVG